MGSAPNELSDFSEEELVKCGEIVMSAKQNAFAFTCIQCKQIFLQMVVFARHVRLKHQVEAEVIEQYQEELEELSIYTVEELLSGENESVLSSANTTSDDHVTEESGSSPIPDSDDTGIDSDEELEKEISALLANIATSDSHSLTGTEFSDDSGLDSKNMADVNSSNAKQEDLSNITEKDYNNFKRHRYTIIQGEKDGKTNEKPEVHDSNAHSPSATIALRYESKSEPASVVSHTENYIKETYSLNHQTKKAGKVSKDNQNYMNYAEPSTKITTDCLPQKNKQKPPSSLTENVNLNSQLQESEETANFGQKHMNYAISNTRAATDNLEYKNRDKSNPTNLKVKENNNLNIQLKKLEENSKDGQKYTNDPKSTTKKSTGNLEHKNKQKRNPTNVIIKENDHLTIKLQKPEEKSKDGQKHMSYPEAGTEEASNNLEHKQTEEPNSINLINNQTKNEMPARKGGNVEAKMIKVVVESINSESEELHNKLDIGVTDELASTYETQYEEELNNELESNLKNVVVNINEIDEPHSECFVNMIEELHKELDIDMTDAIKLLTSEKRKQLHNQLDIDVNHGLESTDKCKELQTEMETALCDDLECARQSIEPYFSTSPIVADTEWEKTNQPFVIVGMDDELAGIQFSKEEIDKIKERIPKVPTYNFKEVHLNNELQNSTPMNSVSAYQMQYVVYSETNAQLPTDISNDDGISITNESTDDVAPLDLSLNKSAEFADMQLGEISKLLTNDDVEQCKITSGILAEVENVLVKQDIDTFNENPTSLYSSNELLTSNSSMDNRKLPPFSKVFKNTANSLNTSNGAFAQSTPKQKPLKISDEKKRTKIASPLRPSAQLNMIPKADGVSNRTENCSNSSNTYIFKKSIKYPFLKRILRTNEKENDTKKRKIDNEAVKRKNIPVEDCDIRESGIQILSVEVLPPNATVADKLKGEDLKNVKFPHTNQATNNMKWVPVSLNNIEEDLIPFVKIDKPSGVCSSYIAADSTTEKCVTSFNELNYSPEETLNQLKLQKFVDEKLLYDSLLHNSHSFTDPLISDSRMTSLLEENSFINAASDEDKENYLLLRPLGLQIIVDPKVEDGMKLKTLETIRAKASLFATIYMDFKHLWKVGKGIKNFEKLELDFNKLLQRINENYKLELTITETKRIINLISLWYMQSYARSLMKKKPILPSVSHYLQLFKFLPKTARRIFYCEECPQYFLCWQNYLAHSEKHLALPYTCPYCQANYVYRKELLQHTKVCITFTCVECNCRFDNVADLEYHLRNEHLLQCETCGKLAATALDLETHEHQYSIICGLCNEGFLSAAELQKHRQDSFHWDYTCHICEIFLPTATQMKHHAMLCTSVRT
ncbi:putative leucine-rich repeat-containing protein DDB_G0290503 [Eurosta solidaginis]|uniref:putative leucine-rich repeat-containing protein DDB_G0290503 n=1 Tax=Eurosta solidaginis TaxID=178769 RepID=UPI00353080E5